MKRIVLQHKVIRHLHYSARRGGVTKGILSVSVIDTTEGPYHRAILVRGIPSSYERSVMEALSER